MRIISGKFKGKKIHEVKGISARPTTDFAKESLFNIIENRMDIEGLKVLDLFAGTGSISFEFASRGAESIIAVDMSLASYQFINSFAFEHKMPLKVIKSDVFKFLKKPTGSFPVIFADPPYALKNIPEIAALVFEHNWLDDDGLLIIEHGKETDLSKLPYFQETRQYSRVNFSFFSKSC